MGRGRAPQDQAAAGPGAPARAVLDIRHWPGRKGWSPPADPDRGERLRDRMALVVAVAVLSEAGAIRERAGVGAWRLVLGGVLLGAGVFHADEASLETRAEVARWASASSVATAAGRKPPEVFSLREFNRRVLYRHGYKGRCIVVGADLGRTFGLLAEHWAPARRPGWRNGWSLGLAGWGAARAKDPRRWSRDTGHPLVYVQASGVHGTRLRYGAARPSFENEPRGEWDRGADGKMRSYPGRFLDLVPAAFCLDGVDSDDLDEHLEAWGLPAAGAPYAAKVGAEGAEVASVHVESLHALALAVDAEAGCWAGGLSLPRMSSPPSVAAEMVARLGIAAPLAKFAVPDAELSSWMAGLHGGRVELAEGFAGMAFPGIDVDVSSAYPAVASLLRWWDHLSAARVRRRRVAGEFRRFLGRADLAEAMCDPETWRRWGVTRVTLRPRGEPLPVALPDGDGAGSHMALAPVHAASFEAAWPDAVAATLLGGHPVEVLSAVQVVAEGHDGPLRRLQVPGVLLDPAKDPACTLVARRQRAKAEGDTRMSSMLRVLGNGMVYGNMARFDPAAGGGERPGPWCWPPLASVVSAGCRCLLAMLDARLRERGSRIAYCDTDGAIIPASREGGSLPVAGNKVRVLPEAELAEVLTVFDRLDPFGTGAPFFAIEAAGTVVAWGPKRYVVLGPDGEVLAHTEHVIGAYVEPPGAGSRGGDRRHAWTAEVTRVLAEIACSGGGDGTLPAFSWEKDAPGFPALSRVVPSSPDALQAMPAALGLRPFARVVEALATFDDVRPVAPDPGGELADWEGLAWHDTRSGERIEVTTRAAQPGRPDQRFPVRLDTLRARAVAWSRDNGRQPCPALVADALLVRLVGRVGGAFTDGSPQPLHRGVDAAGVLIAAAQGIGSARLAELTGLAERTAKAIRAGRRPKPSTLARAMAGLQEHIGPDPLPVLLDLADRRRCRGCGNALPGKASAWCSGACRKRAEREQGALVAAEHRRSRS